jgi:dihydropteroate synthase
MSTVIRIMATPKSCPGMTLYKPTSTFRSGLYKKVLNKEVEHRLIGTIATVTAGILNGAHIVRVHDVKAVKDAVMMADAVMNEHPTHQLL